MSGTAAGLEGSVPSFAGGVALRAAALMLISIPPVVAYPFLVLTFAGWMVALVKETE